MSRKVLFTDGLDPEARKTLEKYSSLFSIEVCENLCREDLQKKISDVEVLSIRTRTVIDAEILKSAKQLKLIARAGTGVDHIDLEAAKSRGIAVMNTASANSVSAAELAIG